MTLKLKWMSSCGERNRRDLFDLSDDGRTASSSQLYGVKSV